MAKLFDKRLLFCSVDIVGSTAFKQKKSEKDSLNRWVEFFNNFAIDFQEILVGCQEKQHEKSLHCKNSKKPFKFWKCLGDELIFYLEIDRAAFLECHLLSFRDAISKFRETLRKKSLSLDVKGVAWFCEFPVTNRQVKISLPVSSRQVKTSPVHDYVGSGMDIGFRIARFSAPEKFVLSAEIPYILVAAGATEHIYYGGKEKLKGVLDDKSYPIFWIKDCDIEGDEAALVRHADNSAIIKYCAKFFEDNKEILYCPFFSKGDKLNTQPEGYKNKCDMVRRLNAVPGDCPKGMDIPPESPSHKKEIYSVLEQLPTAEEGPPFD